MKTSPIHRLLLVAMLAATLACGWALADEFVSGHVEEISTPPSTAPVEKYFAQHKLVGTASCTAAGCHGGADRARVSHGDPWSPVAYNMWIASDPHARSYETLLTEASARMTSKLGLGAAHEQQACLVCHAPEGAHQEFTVSHRSTPLDGVGCEACHGPAEKWLSIHTTSSWADRSASDKQSLGFLDLDDLNVRSRACADCHVGSPGQDVNHDLIAAGHPRLMFEMSALHARLPKHWRDERESMQTIDAKLWVVGRAAAATKSLALLEARAASPHAAWPEFAEYDCYACHHDLEDPSWRQESSLARTHGKAGSLRWGNGNYSLLSLVRGSGSPANNDSLLAALSKEMSRPLPDREVAKSLAQSARWNVESDASTLSAVPIGRYQIDHYLRELSHPELAGDPSWDFASQRFLGLAAMHFSSVASSGRQQSMAGSSIAHRRQSLVKLRRLLQFSTPGEQSRYNNPHPWGPAHREQVREQFDAIYFGVDQL